jgi:hypothetical protein
MHAWIDLAIKGPCQLRAALSAMGSVCEVEMYRD